LEYHTCGNQSAHNITELCSVNMDAWKYRISVACDTLECGPLYLSFPTNMADACTNIQQVTQEEEEKKEGETLHIDK
jgi:hypothetical protein